MGGKWSSGSTKQPEIIDVCRVTQHISPEISLLPKSPNERSRRRSSSGNSPLRPVIAPSAATDWLDLGTFDDDEEEPGPMPIQGGTEDEEARGHMPADEVEAFFQV